MKGGFNHKQLEIMAFHSHFLSAGRPLSFYYMKNIRNTYFLAKVSVVLGIYILSVLCINTELFFCVNVQEFSVAIMSKSIYHKTEDAILEVQDLSLCSKNSFCTEQTDPSSMQLVSQVSVLQISYIFRSFQFTLGPVRAGFHG